MITLLYYNRIVGQIENYVSVSHDFIKQYYLSGVILGMIILTIVLLTQKNRLISFNKFLTIISLILVIFPVLSIGSYEIRTGRMMDAFAVTTQKSDKVVSNNRENPDIYYLILDRYAGKTALEEQYGFDNSAFYAYLENKGFYVADTARANYPKTFLSLASSLNMEYMDERTKNFRDEKGKDQSLVTPFIRDSEVINFLQNRGYTTVNIGSWWTPTQSNPEADINYYLKNKAYFGADEFTTGYINTTIASEHLKIFFKDSTAVSDDPHNNIHRSTVVYEMDALKRASEIPGPKFVFMHAAFPHDPFVFDKNCTPISEEIVRKNTHQENYLEQLQCANLYAKDIIETILKNSDNSAVILLQSDEGPFPMNMPIPDDQSWGSAHETSLREKFPILQTYYIPENIRPQFYESISPVNSFRVVFNSVFNTNYPLLPDKSYVFWDDEQYYTFVDVTEEVK